MTYLPFARDAVSVAIRGTSITNVTTAQLQAIYGSADENTAGTGVTYDATSGLPMLDGQVLHPKLPNQGSGTRRFFQDAIGITTADLGLYVDPAATTPESDGTQLTDTGSLIPFSAARWIGQAKGLATNTTAGLTLTSIDGVAAVTGTGTTSAPGALYGAVNTAGEYNTVPGVGYVGDYNRDVYNVIPTSFLDSDDASQLHLVALLTTAGTSSVPGVKSTAAKTVIGNYGFGVVSYVGASSKYLGAALSH